MIVHDVEQGSHEWLRLRAGKATASQAACLVTPKRLDLSAKRHPYARRLAAEHFLGPLDDGSGSMWTDRGKEMEAEARDWFALEHDAEVVTPGFVTTEDGFAGCSPDGLLDGAGLEIKCPTAETHVGYLLDGGVPWDYRPQVQFSLFVTGFPRWWFLSYCPGLPTFVTPVSPDKEWQAKLGEAVKLLRDEVAGNVARLVALGCKTEEERAAASRERQHAQDAADMEALFDA